MRTRSTLLLSVPVATFALLAAASSASCSSDTAKLADSGAPPGDGGSVTFQPQGCGYQVGGLKDFPTREPHAAAGAGAPKKVRLGLGGQIAAGQPGYADPSKTFAVLWQTDVETTATQIKWGDSATALSNTSSGVSYVVEPALGSPSADGNRWHEAHVCGLQPGRTYYYQVGGGAAGAEKWSAVYSVTTAPAEKSPDPVLIGVTGDTRFDSSAKPLRVWEAVSGRFKSAGAHVALMSGDFVNAGYDQTLWDVWTSAGDSAGNAVFFAMAPGNHDNEQLSYYAQALMPGALGDNYERYSSFDYGPVHVIAFDDYAGIVSEGIDDTGYQAEFLAWLDDDLKKANARRAEVPWIVTFHHHPFFSSTTQSERASERAKVVTKLQPLFDKHHVNLDFAGHDHFFERSKPIVGTTYGQVGGTTYVISAGGGAPEYHTVADKPYSEVRVEYEASTEGMYGILTATPASLELKHYKLTLGMGTRPADDKVIDTFTLSK